MRIKELSIRNFRGIKHLHIQPDKNINIIIGENGAGKSSVLESIAYLLSWFTARITNLKGNGQTIKPDDIHIGEWDAEIAITMELNESREEVKWSLYGSSRKLEKGGRTDLSAMMSLVRHYIKEQENGTISSVPVLAHYKVNRSVVDIPLRVKNLRPDNIFEVYKTSFKNNTGFRTFFSWYRNREDIENERLRYENISEDLQLAAVRSAFSKFFPGWGDMHVQRSPMSMVLTKDGEKLKLTQLSDGELCYLALISDISRKVVIANPNSEDPLQGCGIVLIDEVDLHLHPQWQKEVVDKLMNVFPNIQFFFTTHSPMVVSNINTEQMIILKNGERVEASSSSYGQKVDEVLIDFFDIDSPRGVKVAELIVDAKRALIEKDKARFEELYDEIKGYISNTDGDMIAMKLEAKRIWG